MRTKRNQAQRDMAARAAALYNSILEPGAPMNRTQFPGMAPQGVPDDLIRAHRAHRAGGAAPLAPFPKLVRCCEMVLGHTLTEQDARTYVTRLRLASTGPLNYMRRVKLCAYGLLAAVVCQPHLGDIADLDSSAGALHDVLLYGGPKIASARRCLDACMAFLAGEDIDGSRPRLSSPTPPPPRASEAVQIEMF